MKREYIEKRENEIRKLDKKHLPLFLIFIALCVGAGYLIGIVIGKSREKGMQVVIEKLSSIMLYAGPVLLGAIVVVFTLWAFLKAAKLMRQAKDWDGDDDEAIREIEDRIFGTVNVSNYVLVLIFALFGVNGYIGKNMMQTGEDGAFIMFILGTVLFVAGMAAILLVQHKLLVTEQIINPEKSGSLFMFNFNKHIVSNSDEGEQIIMWKAAYSAHRAVNGMCMAMWLVALIAQMAFSCGVLATMLVSIIWMTDMAVFGRKCRKLQK